MCRCANTLARAWPAATAAAGGKTDVEIPFTLGSAWKGKKLFHILNFNIHKSHYFIRF
jgi:hypothetical protein